MSYLAGLFLCIVVSVVLGDQKYSLVLLSVDRCSIDLGPNAIDFDISLEGDDGARAFNANIRLKREFNRDYTYKINVMMFNAIRYIQYTEASGNMIETLLKLARPVYYRVKKEAKPPIMEEDVVKPGDYILDRFRISADEVDVPIPTEGNFTSKIQLFDPEHKLCLCLDASYYVYEDD